MKQRSFSFRLIVSVAAIALICVVAIALAANLAEGVSRTSAFIPVLAAGFLFLLVSSVVVGRFAKAYGFNYATCEEDDCYEGALSRLGETPIKALALFLLIAVAFLCGLFAVEARGLLLPGSGIPLFLFTLSWGMLDAAFVYVLGDKLGTETLLDQKLVHYPSRLRESRQQLKIFIIPIFMSLMSLMFAFSFTFLAVSRGEIGTDGFAPGTIIKGTIVTALYFFVVIVLVRIWNTNTSLLYRSIIAQLELLASSEKDLTRRIHIASVDELGTMAGMVNAFCEGLEENFSNLKAAQGELNALGEDLGNNADEAARTIAQVSSSVGQVREKTQNQSTSVGESSSAVEQIAKNIESLDSLIAEQASSVTEASASIEEMVANINSMTEAFKKTSEQFGSLLTAAGEGRAKQAAAGERVTKITERSQSLLEANKVIATIAAQTNLLAMNAAIEAAHAGNAGLGFSVVADEIRRLAETSGKQSGMIKGEIAQVQKAIEEVVSSSKDSEAAFTRVTERIGETDVLMQEVRMAMEEQKEGSKQILEALRVMNDITSQVKVGSREMNEGNNTVLDEIAKLRGATSEIKINIEEMARGTDGITESAQKVSLMAEGLRNTIKEMDGAIGCFRTS